MPIYLQALLVICLSLPLTLMYAWYVRQYPPEIGYEFMIRTLPAASRFLLYQLTILPFFVLVSAKNTADSGVGGPDAIVDAVKTEAASLIANAKTHGISGDDDFGKADDDPAAAMASSGKPMSVSTVLNTKREEQSQSERIDIGRESERISGRNRV